MTLHRFATLLPLVLLATPLATFAGRLAQTNLPPVEGEVIVRFKADAGTLRKHILAARAEPTSVSATLAQRAATLGSRVGLTLEAGAPVGERMQVMRASGVSAQALAVQLQADPDVEFAVPNGRQRRLAAPNDPYYLSGPTLNTPALAGGPVSGQWYLRAPTAIVASAIDIERAWARTSGSAAVVIAVLDTGVRGEHPDLSGRLVPGYDFISNAAVANDGNGRDADASDPGDWVSASDTGTTTFSNCRVEPSSWHGTAAASLVGAATNDNTGMAGAAPGARILPVRVLGKCYGADSDIQAGMLWAAGISVAGVPDNPNPAKVINLSLGGSSGACSAAYQAVVDQIVARGVVIVVAAGNSAGGPVNMPANCNGVIAVLALRNVGTKVSFSDLGPEIAIAAPGGNCDDLSPGAACQYPILTATNIGTQGPISSSWTDSFNTSVGTSFASPLVAGTVGLMLSVQPNLPANSSTPALIRSRLQATARAFPSSGADNGTDPTPVTQCRAPSTITQQLQCYCTANYCGAGMMDAGSAVNSVASPIVRIEPGTTSPIAGSAMTLSAGSSLPGLNATLTSYQWSIVDGGGIVSAFSGASNAVTVSVVPRAAGSFTLRVTVQDSLGASGSADLVVTVGAAPSSPPVSSPGGGDGGGGGGAVSLGWLALLALAVVLLSRRDGRFDER